MENAEDYFHEDMATFGDRLAAARDASGLGQAQLAKRLGVKVATVVNWEDDRAEPRANRIQMLAGILGVSITWLLSGQGDGPTVTTDEGEQVEFAALLTDLRRIRVEQARLNDQMAVVEKRLRALLG